MNSIRDKILSKGRTKELTEEELITLHHDLMVCYGWIPLDEFKKIPLPMLWNLNKLCQKEKQMRINFMFCVLKGQGFKDSSLKGIFK